MPSTILRTLAFALLLASVPARAAEPPIAFRVPTVPAGAPRLTRGFVGLSFETGELSTGLFDAADAPLVRLFREIGAGLLRIGGNSDDLTIWDDGGDTNGHGKTKGFVTPSDVDRLAGFLQATTAWHTLYSLDLATGNGSAMEREARYVASALPHIISAIAIGNEPDLYPKIGYRDSTYTYSQYTAEWSLDRGLITTEFPNLPVSGPDASYDTTHYTLPFIAQFGAGLRLATQHYYIASSCSGPTVASFLKADAGLQKIATALVAAAAKAGVHGGVRYDEVNSYYTCTNMAGQQISGTPGVSDSFGSALWAIDLMAGLAKVGVSGVNFHSGGHAIYAPIQTANGAVIAVKPEFYGIWVFARALRDCPCALIAAMRDLERHAGLNVAAIQRSNGSVALLFTNESSSDATVALSGLAGSSLRQIILTSAGGLSDTDPADVMVNGVTIGVDGTWSGPVVPATGAISAGAASVTAPAQSAVLIVAP